jgi:ankyrin repeat protein
MARLINKRFFIAALCKLACTLPALSGAAADTGRCKAEPALVLQYLGAARENDADALMQALAAGVPVDCRDDRGRTALLIATHANAIDTARLLIASGADVNAKDDIEDSPYLYAGAEGRLEILKMTLEAGADLASVNRYGGTALTPAAHHGHLEVVRFLLTTPIDVDHVNKLGWTALLEAVILGDGGPSYQAIVEELLTAGADPSIEDSDGVTALQHARSRQFDAMASIIEPYDRRN